MPQSLQQAVSPSRLAQARQTAISVFPCPATQNLRVLQAADPDISAVAQFWGQDRHPSPKEWQGLSAMSLSLLRQWNHLVEEDGILYRRTFRPDGGEEVLQLVLPAALRPEVMTQLHQDHGHQGVERTLELIR